MSFLSTPLRANTANVRKTNSMTEREESEKIVPAFFVPVVDLGTTFKKGELPLHMTLFPPIKQALIPADVDDLRRYIDPMPAFEVKIGESDPHFGPNRNKHVKLIEESPRVFAVQRAILAAFGHTVSHDRQFRLPYRPHFSIKEDDTRLVTGETTIKIAGLSLVEWQVPSQQWQVMAKIGLDGLVGVK